MNTPISVHRVVMTHSLMLRRGVLRRERFRREKVDHFTIVWPRDVQGSVIVFFFNDPRITDHSAPVTSAIDRTHGTNILLHVTLLLYCAEDFVVGVQVRPLIGLVAVQHCVT